MLYKVKFTDEWCRRFGRRPNRQRYTLTPLPHIRHPARRKRLSRYGLHLYVQFLILFRDSIS